MKKTLLTLAFFALVFTTYAQEQGQIRVGGGLAFGSETGIDGGNLGITLIGEYLITDEISAVPSYTYFFESSEGPASVRFSSFNLDGRYYFLTDDIQVYGLLGIAFLSVNSEFEDPFFGGTFEASDTETGLNIGGGVVLPLSDKVGLNGQLKYQTPGDGQLVINGGVLISVN